MQEIIESTIASSSLFKHLSDQHKNYLSSNAQVFACAADEVIIAEGTSVAYLYIVYDGVVRVSTNSISREVELKKLGKGAYFGEVSVLSGKNATATVAAMEQGATLVAIKKDALGELIKEDDHVRRVLEGVTLARAKDTISKVLK